MNIPLKDRLAIIDMIKSYSVFTTLDNLEEAIKWSEKHSETKPRFLVKSGNHVLIY